MNSLKTKKIITLPLLLLSCYYCIAQQKGDATGGSVSISSTLEPKQSFKDTTGGFGYHSFNANISVPLFGNRNKIMENIAEGGHLRFYQTSIHGGFESFNPTIDFIKTQHNFYTASLGLGGVFFNGKKNIILVDAAIGFAADGLTIQNGDLQYRFSGLFIVNHIHSQSTSYQYGVIFTYAYGRPLPLPVLGIRKKLSDKWSFAALLPVSIQFTDKLNKEMRLTFLLKPAGNRFQFQNQNDFNTTSSTVFMQLRQFELGISYQYRFAKQFSFGAEAGLVGGGNLKFTEINDSKTVLYQTGVNSGAKFRLSLRYNLPHKKALGSNMDMDGEMFKMN